MEGDDNDECNTIQAPAEEDIEVEEDDEVETSIGTVM